MLKSKVHFFNNESKKIVRDNIYNKISNSEEGLIYIYGNKAYGKTDIMSYCMNHNSSMAFTYILDDLDNDIDVFFKYMYYFFSEAYGMEFSKSCDIDKARMGRTFIEDLISSQISQKMYLYIDNYQFITNKAIHSFIVDLVINFQGIIKVVIASRTKTPYEFNRLIENGVAKVFDKQVLRLNENEINSLFDYYGIETETYKTMFNMSVFPIGEVCIALNYIKNSKAIESENGIDIVLNESGLLGSMQNYLVTNFNQDIIDFMVCSAVVDKFDIRMCEEVFNCQHALMYIRKILDIGDVLTPADKNGYYCYTYIARICLKDMCSLNKRKELYKLLERYYFENLQMEDALSYGLRAEDIKGILEILESDKSYKLYSATDGTVKEVINYINLKRIEVDYRICGVFAQYSYNIGEYQTMDNYLNKADSMFGKENKYGAYRSLYRGLIKYHENIEECIKKINSAIFYLKENDITLPYIRDEHQKILDSIIKNDSKDSNTKKIKVTSFGEFSVKVLSDGKELSWRTKKGQEVFAYLIDLQGKSIDRRKLLQDLWSEEMPNNAVAMLHNMFYNIRKDLAVYNLDGIIEYKNKKYSIDMSMIDSEIGIVEAICKLVSQGKQMELIKYEDNFKTYWGRYLDDIDCSWGINKKEYYETTYVKGCCLLGDYYFKQNKYKEASTYYRNACDIDVYSEQIVCNLLKCYGGLQDLKKIKEKYAMFKKILKNDLDVEPGAQVKEVYLAYISK